MESEKQWQIDSFANYLFQWIIWTFIYSELSHTFSNFYEFLIQYYKNWLIEAPFQWLSKTIYFICIWLVLKLCKVNSQMFEICYLDWFWVILDYSKCLSVNFFYFIHEIMLTWNMWNGKKTTKKLNYSNYVKTKKNWAKKKGKLLRCFVIY